MIRPNALQFITRTRLVTFLLLIALAFAALPAMPALAATSTISDQASCEAHGGSWYGRDCRYYSSNPALTVAAGDVLLVSVWVNMDTLTNNGTIQFVGGGYMWTYWS